MLVIPQSQALALKLNNPAPVLAAIPSARSKVVGGRQLVVLPHRLDEIRVLNNIGVRAPSPILYYYDWPGRYTPFTHQRQTAAFLTLHRRALVLNDIGTGKSLSALWAADYLMRIGCVHKVLILSPLSTLERVWGDAIFSNFLQRRFRVLSGRAERRLKLLHEEADFYICNHDGFPVIMDEAQGMFDLVIADEASVYRNPSAKRFKYLRNWLQASNPSPRLWLMTGTPTPEEPTNAWTLARLVGNPNCPTTYRAFRDMVMLKVAMWKYVPRAGASDIVREILQPAVRFTREDCLDLPATTVQARHVELSAEQRKHYNTMMKSLVAEVVNTTSAGTIAAVNEAAKVQKLVQIACGVAYDEHGKNVELDCSPRIRVMEEVIEEAGGKVIVFVPLTGTLHMLERELGKRWTVGVVNGEVPTAARNTIFHNFQHGESPRVLLAHPATMAHGLTLTAAGTIVWYGPIYSNEYYEQANGRIERIGKTQVSTVIHLEATELERAIYSRLQGKQKLQGLLLDLIESSTGTRR